MKRKDLLFLLFALIFSVSIGLYTFKNFESKKSSTQPEASTPKALTQAEKEKALYDLLKKQGRLPKDWKPQQNKQAQPSTKAQREYKSPRFRSWHERNLRKALLKPKYALVLNQNKTLLEDLWTKYEKEKTKNPELFIKKNVDSIDPDKILTPNNQQSTLTQLDQTNKAYLNSLPYDDLRGLCREIGGSYQGQRTHLGAQYFLENCFCSQESRALSKLSWSIPYLWFITCE